MTWLTWKAVKGTRHYSKGTYPQKVSQQLEIVSQSDPHLPDRLYRMRPLLTSLFKRF
jgi:hypothetical protein